MSILAPGVREGRFEPVLVLQAASGLMPDGSIFQVLGFVRALAEISALFPKIQVYACVPTPFNSPLPKKAALLRFLRTMVSLLRFPGFFYSTFDQDLGLSGHGDHVETGGSRIAPVRESRGKPAFSGVEGNIAGTRVFGK